LVFIKLRNSCEANRADRGNEVALIF